MSQASDPPAPKLSLSRARATWLASLLGAGLLVILLVWEGSSLLSERRTEVQEWRSHLESLAESRARAVEGWLADQRVAAHIESTRLVVRQFLGNGSGQIETAQVLAEDCVRARYRGIALFAPDGRLRLAVPGGAVSETLERMARDPATGRLDLPTVTLHPGDAAGATLHVATPVEGGATGRLGTLVLDLDSRRALEPLLASGTSPATSETLLLAWEDGSARLLAPARPIGLAAPPRPLVRAALPVAPPGARVGFGRFIDDRGVPVFAVTRDLPAEGWTLVVQIDEREALATWRSSASERLARSLGLLLSLLALSWLLVHESRRRDFERTALRDARYRLLLDQASDAVFIASAIDGRIVEANLAAERLYGYTHEEFRRLTLVDLRSSSSQFRMHELLLDATAAETAPASSRHRRRDGSELDVEVSGGRLSGEGEPLVLAIVRDVSRRKRAEDRLERIRRLLGTALELNSVALTVESRDTLAGEICARLVADGGFRMARVALADDGSHELRVAAATPSTGFEPFAGDAAAHAAFREGRAVVEEDARGLPSGCTHAIHLPLHSGASTIGVCSVFECASHDLDNGVRRVLEQLVADLGLRIDLGETTRQLARSETRYRLLFDSNPMAMWVYDRSTLEILDANDAAAVQYGYPRARLLALRLPDLHPERDRELVYETVDVGAGPLRRPGVMRHLRADGETIEVEVVTHDVDFAGRPARLALLQNVTERERSARALRESEERFRSTFEDAPVGIAILATESFVVLRANQAACDLLGRPTHEVVGSPFTRFAHPEDLPLMLGRIRSMLNGQDLAPRVHRRLLDRNGHAVWTELSARLLRDDLGKPLYFVAIVQDITARLEGERALQESEERFRSAFEEGPVPMSLTAPSGRILRMNRAFADMLGRSEEEIVAGSYRELTHPDDMPASLAAADRALADPRPQHFEKRYLRDDGSVVWADVSLRLLRDADGQPLYFVTIAQDVTARRRAEEALRDSEQRLKVAVESTQIGLWEWDVRNGRVAYSREWKALLGYGEHEVADRFGEFERLTLPEDAVHNAESIAVYIARPEGYHTSEFRMRHKDGSLRWILSRAAAVEVDDAGRAVRLVGCHLDVTSRKQAEEDLREALERFELVSRASHDVVWDWDLRADTIWWSEGLTSALGHPGGGAVTSSQWWRDHVHPDDLARVSSSANHAVESGLDHWHEEYRFQNGAGDYVEVDDRGFLVHESVGHPRRMVGAMTDVSERRRAQREIERINAQLEERVRERTAELEAANRELESFSYSVSHDLRAPLRAISGFARILSDLHAAQLDAEGLRLLGVVRNNTQRMGQLVDDLLSFSRVSRQELRRTMVDMTALAESAWRELVADDPGPPAVLDIQPLPSAHCDVSLLRQVWLNLLANALKFSTPRAERRVEVRGWHENGWAWYAVRDNGVGFDMAYADKLFGVFQRLHGRDEFEGTGVGLALVQRIVQRHGGAVRAEGVLDGGATFSFRLKAAPDDRTDGGSTPPA